MPDSPSVSIIGPNYSFADLMELRRNKSTMTIQSAWLGSVATKDGIGLLPSTTSFEVDRIRLPEHWKWPSMSGTYIRVPMNECNLTLEEVTGSGLKLGVIFNNVNVEADATFVSMFTRDPLDQLENSRTIVCLVRK